MMQRNNSNSSSSNNNQNNNNNGSGSHPACASCKHQRKKCGEGCILAPYFSADKTKEFQAVHKVFGVSNVTKMVRDVKEEERKLAAESFIWEAICRENSPVLGPLGEYRKLQEELNLCRREIQILKQNLNQMQAMQSTGSLMYKPPSAGAVGWNNTCLANETDNKGSVEGELANNMMNYGHDNGNIIIDANAYNYPYYLQTQENLVKDKISVGSQLLVPRHQQQQQLQQQYYLSGQFGSVNSKTMDHTTWEDGL